MRAEKDKGARKGGKPNVSKGGAFADRKGKRPFGGRRGPKEHFREGKALPKDPAAKLEFLDRELDSYWVKGGHVEVGK